MCLQLLQSKWIDVERREDVKEIKGTELGSVDIISGGFPCQDVSVAGRRKGIAGERSGLWFEFHRILEETKSRWAIIENVPGLLSSNGGEDFAIILRGLAQLGYGVAYRILDAQYFGVAQRRRRVFIIGSLGNWSSIEVLFESESLQRNIAPSQEERQTTPAILGSGPPGSRRDDEDGLTIAKSLARGNRNNPADEHFITGAISARWAKGSGGPAGDEAYNLVASPLRSRSSVNSNTPGRGGEDDENIVIGFAPGNSADSYGIGEQENISPPVRGGGAGAKPRIAIMENQRGEIRTSDQTDSIKTGGGKPGQGYAAVQSQRGIRRLTPTECERLQGFPDGWTNGFSDTARYKMLGNAVCVNVAEWVGRRIMEHASPQQLGR